MTEYPREQRFSVPEEKPGYVYGYGDYPWMRLRSVVGGIFMGLASVVPGVSGGTMLLAAGAYPFFMEGLYDISALHVRKRSVVVVGIVLLSAMLSVLLLGPYMRAVTTQYRWASYSLFAGLALGGVPVVLGMAKPITRSSVIAFLAGLVFALGMISLRAYMTVPIDQKVGFVWYFLGGLLAGGAMVLPGISGAYLLVLLGVFLPIMDALDVLREGATSGNVGTAFGQTLPVLGPAALGTAIGILLLSRLFHRLLTSSRKTTLGVLVGLLVGALFELWPFQRIVEPHVGDVLGGERLTAEALAQLPAWRYPFEYYVPSAGEVVSCLVLVVLGAVLTSMGARFGARNESGYDLAARTQP